MKPTRLVGRSSWLSVALATLCVAACAPGAPPTVSSTAVATLAIGVDLPFEGSSKEATDATWNAMNLYLERIGGRAGPYQVELIKYNNAPNSSANWDDSECLRNANNHVGNRREVAVIGTYFVACSKAQAPVLNMASDGPMLLVSHTDNNPGLTRAWDAGEPARYAPAGRQSYARVVTRDDLQGPGAARFAATELGVKKCFVLNDGETYGTGLAAAFADAARRQGIQVVGEARWKHDADDYRAVFGGAKAAGADCVYFGGIYDNNGGQLTADKVAVLGDNDAVKLLAPNGFAGYPEFARGAAGAGAYLTAPGLPVEALSARGDVAARFLADYRGRYGAELRTGDAVHGVIDLRAAQALYGVQALQVVLAAIGSSDGSRRSVRDQVFEGAGVTIGADRAILGTAVSIDVATGDVNAREVSVLLVKDGRETFVKGERI